MSNAPAAIANDCVATIHYVLRNPEGEVLDQSTGGEPLSYLHGHGNIVPGLESTLTGRAVGDTVEVVVAPEDGYGPSSENALRQIPRNAFPEGVQAGMQLLAEAEGGGRIPLWVMEVGAQVVTVSLDHPLAGVPLHFTVEVVEIRAAKENELAHGHPHGRYGDAGHHH